MNLEFRKLKASEIDARVATVTAKGCSLLLYKDARVDQKVLDETVGAFNWERSHEVIDGNLYCTVRIYDDDRKMWVSKQDVGTESYTEKEKGQASDSFKRACFNWGIGRELYTAPFIWISEGDCKIEQKNGGGYTTRDTFKVTSIAYDQDGNINHLEIKNNKTHKVCYQLGCKEINDTISMKEQTILAGMVKDKGYEVEEIFPKGLNLTTEQYLQAIETIKKLKAKK
jgi:hypothetical protein